MRRNMFMLLLFGVAYGAVTEPVIQYGEPSDLGPWREFRGSVRRHPVSLVKSEDLERAHQNMERYGWARRTAEKIRSQADAAVKIVTAEYLLDWVSVTTPKAGYSPCPGCRDAGLRWHPNGTWQWNPARPNEIKCRTCKTVFPNSKYPEDVVLLSKWDPRQVFTFVGGKPFNVYGFMSRPSPSGIIRTRKLHSVLSHLNNLGYAYGLYGNPEHAECARLILLRLAEVVPHYMLNVAIYQEIADCEPHAASMDPFHLPSDELTVPPNVSDRQLHTGYWSGNRLGTAGGDGGLIANIACAYDLVCEAKRADGTPVFTEEERLRIEKDVLLELTWHGIYDTSINNKSVGNRAGVGVVGMVCGHPGMVRFGIDGFVKTIGSWFLPDGGTSESSSYAMMTMSNILQSIIVFRRYSEPTGYVPPNGAPRLDDFEAARDTDLGLCCQNLVWSLLGNMRFASQADSHLSTQIGGAITELMALSYPSPENLAFLKANSPQGAGLYSLFYRNPEMPDAGLPPFRLNDVVFPYLSQGYLRRGALGMDSAAILNASNWGGHHHFDSLNLYLWYGDELLSDLGYLWDHPDSRATYRTMAHNLVMIDGREQDSRGRGGSFTLFGEAGPVKAMQASSKAYPSAEVYERTVLQIEHGAGGFYWLDLFRAKGGARREYIFHGPNNDFVLSGVDKALFATDAHSPGEILFTLQLAVQKLGTLEVSNVELCRCDLDGKPLGPNIAVPFPPESPAENCIFGWGYYQGNGKSRWEACPGMTGTGVRFLAESVAPGKDMPVNHALCIGGSTGYISPKAFKGRKGESYLVRFRARGTVGAIIPRCLFFYPGEENDANKRNYINVSMDRMKVEADWQPYEAVITFSSSICQGKKRRGPEGRAWSAVWNINKSRRFAAFTPATPGETLLYADEWGQRNYYNADRGATLPYFFRERKGDTLDNFVTVFHTYEDDNVLVKGVKTAELPGGTLEVVVSTADGDDVIIFSNAKMAYDMKRKIRTDAAIAVVTHDGTAMFGGTLLDCPRNALTAARASWQGTRLKAVNEGGNAWFAIPAEDAPAPLEWNGQAFIVTDEDGISHAYPVHAVTREGNELRIHTRTGYSGFPAHSGKAWSIQGATGVR